ncbi:MAG: MBL fold metallo-hydrolase [Bacteroidales bacterium]|nr:MAG: MBL fold metallo-hydrolase [Bacteroidales bacterium]
MGSELSGTAQEEFEKDVIETADGPVEMTMIGHGTLMFTFGDQVIHIDPVAREADYKNLPKADLILVTHEHGDHLDISVINLIRKPNTKIIVNVGSEERVEGGIAMKNGDTEELNGIKIEAIPAYNIQHTRSNGQPYHPKGTGNGYVITMGDKRIYIAGDTENIPEMKSLKNIDVAFLPMNLPYTMTPEMVADAAKTFRPKILYPYHYGNTDTNELISLLKDEQDIEVRIRKLE